MEEVDEVEESAGLAVAFDGSKKGLGMFQLFTWKPRQDATALRESLPSRCVIWNIQYFAIGYRDILIIRPAGFFKQTGASGSSGMTKLSGSQVDFGFRFLFRVAPANSFVRFILPYL